MNACSIAIEIRNALIRQQVTVFVTTPEVCNITGLRLITNDREKLVLSFLAHHRLIRFSTK